MAPVFSDRAEKARQRGRRLGSRLSGGAAATPPAALAERSPIVLLYPRVRPATVTSVRGARGQGSGEREALRTAMAGFVRGGVEQSCRTCSSPTRAVTSPLPV